MNCTGYDIFFADGVVLLNGAAQCTLSNQQAKVLFAIASGGGRSVPVEHIARDSGGISVAHMRVVLASLRARIEGSRLRIVNSALGGYSLHIYPAGTRRPGNRELLADIRSDVLERLVGNRHAARSVSR